MGSGEHLIKFDGLNVLIMPLTALGDLTIYLHLAWLFHCGGAKVTLMSNILQSTQRFFPWVNIVDEENDIDFEKLSKEFDLVIACYEKYYKKGALINKNIAFVTAKKISKRAKIDGASVEVLGQTYFNATRSFCLDSSSGKTMVEWVEHYAEKVYGLQPVKQVLPITNNIKKNEVLIFPTTPHSKKNYWLKGFIFIAKKLRKNGWKVSFVCMPKEKTALELELKSFPLISFNSIDDLMEAISASAYVISNDSGGGHLASLCGIDTFTLTRRNQKFTWRPGFSGENTVVSPTLRFKFLGKYIWRPFLPVWKIYRMIGKSCGQS